MILDIEFRALWRNGVRSCVSMGDVIREAGRAEGEFGMRDIDIHRRYTLIGTCLCRVRHSPGLGMNSQTQRSQSRSLSALRVRPNC